MTEIINGKRGSIFNDYTAGGQAQTAAAAAAAAALAAKAGKKG